MKGLTILCRLRYEDDAIGLRQRLEARYPALSQLLVGQDADLDHGGRYTHVIVARPKETSASAEAARLRALDFIAGYLAASSDEGVLGP